MASTRDSFCLARLNEPVYRDSKELRISWLEARQGFTPDDVTPFELSQSTDLIPGSSILSAADPQVEKREQECEICGSGLCTECVHYVLSVSEFQRIQQILDEAVRVRDEIRKVTGSQRSIFGPQKEEIAASAGKRRRTKVRPF